MKSNKIALMNFDVCGVFSVNCWNLMRFYSRNVDKWVEIAEKCLKVPENAKNARKWVKFAKKMYEWVWNESKWAKLFKNSISEVKTLFSSSPVTPFVINFLLFPKTSTLSALFVHFFFYISVIFCILPILANCLSRFLPFFLFLVHFFPNSPIYSLLLCYYHPNKQVSLKFSNISAISIPTETVRT